MSGPCCSPARQSVPGEPPAVVPMTSGDGVHRVGQRPIAGGTFTMGDARGDGLRPDGELPLHTVDLDRFVIDETTVTAADFAAFVDATGYRTSAERAGTSAVFHALLDDALLDDALLDDAGSVVGEVAAAPWWLVIRGADWAHPEGPGSDIATRADHPVVHVSFTDAEAYCAWSGRALPTEAQWEYAARGGLDGARFPWGDDLVAPGDDGEGSPRCRIYAPDIWGAPFPGDPGGAAGLIPTAPAMSYAPNGFGLRQMVGNVWEWCADRYDPRYYRHSPRHHPTGPQRGASRVLRGGSYLCDDSYCSRYRVAARSHNTVESSTGNTGFRTVAAPDR